jgi:hypothetical protein
MTAPALEPLVTLPALARQLNKSRSSVWRWLLQAHAADREAKRPEWMVRVGTKWRVNMTTLRSEHPSFFGVRRLVSVDDLDSLHERLSDIERQLAERCREEKKTRASIRDLRAELQVVAQRKAG